jgi:hypothetical protein
VLRVRDVLKLETMRPKGNWYEATVPDTLDLAERAKLAINALIGNLEPTEFYAVDQAFMFNANPPYVDPKSATWNISPKNARTLPMLRVMSGSDFGLEAEYGLMGALMSQSARTATCIIPSTALVRPKGLHIRKPTRLPFSRC